MALNDIDKLNLPEAPDFISEPPQFTVEEMIQLCEPLLPYYNRQRLENPEPVDIPPFVIRDEDD